MIKKQIAFHSTEIEEMYTLYQQAFPKNEQMDLTRLFDELHLGAIYGYYQENQLVGFAILCIQSQIAHILYLAVKKEYRDQGSYIYGDVSDKDALTIYGSLNTSVKKKIDYKRNIVVIKGGNHANFGNYGHQKGDAKATISRKKQQNQTVKAINNFIEKRLN